MSTTAQLSHYMQRYPALGALAYGMVMLALALTCWLFIADVLDHRADLNSASELFAQLQRHFPAPSGANAAGTPQGLPFLAGQTVTIAGAGLLQRVSNAVARVGGRVLSSQIDLQGAHARPGFISVLVNCEIDQPGLQKLLYDLEAGMPFLFIDQLEVQAVSPSGSAASAQAPRMHVLLSASGQWLAKP